MHTSFTSLFCRCLWTRCTSISLARPLSSPTHTENVRPVATVTVLRATITPSVFMVKLESFKVKCAELVSQSVGTTEGEQEKKKGGSKQRRQKTKAKQRSQEKIQDAGGVRRLCKELNRKQMIGKIPFVTAYPAGMVCGTRTQMLLGIKQESIQEQDRT